MAEPRHLLVVRHAKSDRDVPGDDHDRPLTGRGRRDAVALGRHLARGGPVDLVLCSSALRARQTCDLATAELPEPPEVDVRRDLYLAPPSAVLGLVRQLGDDVRRVAVVGHEPTASALVARLAAEADPAAAQGFDAGFVTSAVATLELRGPWSSLGPGSCRLVSFDVPRG